MTTQTRLDEENSHFILAGDTSRKLWAAGVPPVSRLMYTSELPACKWQLELRHSGNGFVHTRYLSTP